MDAICLVLVAVVFLVMIGIGIIAALLGRYIFAMVMILGALFMAGIYISFFTVCITGPALSSLIEKINRRKGKCKLVSGSCLE